MQKCKGVAIAQSVPYLTRNLPWAANPNPVQNAREFFSESRTEPLWLSGKTLAFQPGGPGVPQVSAILTEVFPWPYQANAVVVLSNDHGQSLPISLPFPYLGLCQRFLKALNKIQFNCVQSSYGWRLRCTQPPIKSITRLSLVFLGTWWDRRPPHLTSCCGSRICRSPHPP